jgi:argininosuccinate lyase
MKLWAKDTTATHELVERFTVGNDRQMDVLLAEWDVIGSLAHTQMLESIGLLTHEERRVLHQELKHLLATVRSGGFVIDEGVEDVHSQVEFLLTERLGDVGKKIHSGRSRNDQVLVDIKLLLRHEIQQIVTVVLQLFTCLQELSERHKHLLMPGYTHLQIAMPSSFGLWFGAYAESLVDDVTMLHAAYSVVNKNPLGSAAGYGSSFPLNRTMTTELLGFATLNYNVVYAQMGRGKAERITAQALASVAATLGRLAMDVTLFMNQNFGFVRFPDTLTTGSSIMPHKKNPDVFELIRARCNKLQALPNEIAMICTNLPVGYHRDMQILKESLFPAFEMLRSCVEMASFALSQIHVQENILHDERYAYVFSVEEVNQRVIEGMSFREAYKHVGNAIAEGTFVPPSSINHTHEGSIGNLCTAEIRLQMEHELAKFPFAAVAAALERLTA